MNILSNYKKQKHVIPIYGHYSQKEHHIINWNYSATPGY
jgi:hypothetical protein